MLTINSLYMGDCLDLLQEIPDKSVDMILCDLPYGTTCCKWDSPIDFAPLWAHYLRVIQTNGTIVLTAAQPFTSALVMSNPALFRYAWIWEKEAPTGFLNANYAPLKQTEDVLVFSQATVGSLSKNKIRYFPQGVKEINVEKKNNPNSTWRKNKGYAATGNKLNSDSAYVQKYTGYPSNILRFSRDPHAIHPTQKPVALFEYLIKTYTREGEVVLDNCAGSGTTAIACLRTGRNFILIEKDPEYFGKMRDRIDNALKEMNSPYEPIFPSIHVDTAVHRL